MAATIVLLGAVAASPAQASCIDVRQISIGDARAYEGTAAGTTMFVFTVISAICTDAPATVSFSTPASPEHGAASGTLSWAAGDDTPRVVAVNVIRDSDDEPNHQFAVTLAPVAGPLNIADGTGIGTILDDDGPLKWNIDDTTCTEGSNKPAGISWCAYTITLSRPAPSGMSVKVSATDAGAISSGPQADYTAFTNQQVSFLPGSTIKQDVLVANADSFCEGDENIALTLTAPSAGTIADATAVMTILNDDFFC